MRSVLGILYDRLYAAHQENPESFNAENLLRAIAQEQGDIAHIELGKGSDFDLLLSSKSPDYHKHRAQLEQQGRQILNSVAYAIFGHTRMDNSRETEARSLVLRADFHDYDQQISRVKHFGGSTLDHLSFSMRGEGSFREPHPPRVNRSILHSFILGEVAYLAEANEPRLHGWRDEERAIKTLRGFRVLPEIPFLRIAPGESEQILHHELTQIAEALERGQRPSDDALRVYQTLERNGRHGNAHNRFLRSENSPLESQFMHLTARLQDATEKVLIHEMVPEMPLGRTAKSVPAEFLLDWNVFLKNYTDDGVVYHGTPDIDGSLAILQSGAYLSRAPVYLNLPQGRVRLPAQGGSLSGPGAYATAKPSEAAKYEHQTGLTLPLRFSKRPVNVFQWDHHHDEALKAGSSNAEPRPWTHALGRRAQSEINSKDFQEVRARVFEILRDEYGVDVVVNNHVVILNWNSVERPTNLFTAKLNQIQRTISVPDALDVDAAHRGLLIERAAQASGATNHLFQPAQARRVLEQASDSADSETRIIAAEYLRQIHPSEANLQRFDRLVRAALEKADPPFHRDLTPMSRALAAFDQNAELETLVNVVEEGARALDSNGRLPDLKGLVIQRVLVFLNRLHRRTHNVIMMLNGPYQPWETSANLRSALEKIATHLDESLPLNHGLLNQSLILAGELGILPSHLGKRILELAEAGHFDDDPEILDRILRTGSPKTIANERLLLIKTIFESKTIPLNLKRSLFDLGLFYSDADMKLTGVLADFFLAQDGQGMLYDALFERPGAETIPLLQAWLTNQIENHSPEINTLTFNPAFLAHSSILLALLKTDFSFNEDSRIAFHQSLELIDFNSFTPAQQSLLLSRYSRFLGEPELNQNKFFRGAEPLHRAALRFARQNPTHPASELIQQNLAHLDAAKAADVQCVTDAMAKLP